MARTTNAAADGTDAATSENPPGKTSKNAETSRKRKRTAIVQFDVDAKESKLTPKEKEVDEIERKEEGPVGEEVELKVLSDLDEQEQEQVDGCAETYWGKLHKLFKNSCQLLDTGSVKDDDDFATKCQQILEEWREFLNGKDSQLKIPHDTDNLLQEFEKIVSHYLSMMEKKNRRTILEPR